MVEMPQAEQRFRHGNICMNLKQRFWAENRGVLRKMRPCEAARRVTPSQRCRAVIAAPADRVTGSPSKARRPRVDLLRSVRPYEASRGDRIPPTPQSGLSAELLILTTRLQFDPAHARDADGDQSLRHLPSIGDELGCRLPALHKFLRP